MKKFVTKEILNKFFKFCFYFGLPFSVVRSIWRTPPNLNWFWADLVINVPFVFFVILFCFLGGRLLISLNLMAVVDKSKEFFSYFVFFPLSILLSCVIMSEYAKLLGHTFNPQAIPRVFNITPFAWFVEDSLTVMTGILCFLVVQRMLAVKTLELENLKTKISALTIQINPHFLFNTLNTIAYYIKADPSLSERMTIKLSNLFQKILEASKKEKQSLEEELNISSEYLDIEKIRFPQKFSYEVRVDPSVSTKDIMLPSLVLQPLVENAFKYGISKSEDPGTISILIRKKRFYHIIIKNTQVKDETEISKGSQTAFENCKKRLELIYREKATLTLDIPKDKNKETTVELTIPIT